MHYESRFTGSGRIVSTESRVVAAAAAQANSILGPESLERFDHALSRWTNSVFVGQHADASRGRAERFGHAEICGLHRNVGAVSAQSFRETKLWQNVLEEF